MGEEKQKIFEPKTRKLEGQTLKAFNIFAALFAGFYLYTAGFGIFSTESHRAMYLPSRSFFVSWHILPPRGLRRKLQPWIMP